jgi:hypothetical protein
VDAKGVSRLYEGRVRRSDVMLLVGSALTVILVMIFASEALRVFGRAVWLTLRDVFT